MLPGNINGPTAHYFQFAPERGRARYDSARSRIYDPQNGSPGRPRLESQFRCSREMWPRARISLPRRTPSSRVWKATMGAEGEGSRQHTRGDLALRHPRLSVGNEIIAKGSGKSDGSGDGRVLRNFILTLPRDTTRCKKEKKRESGIGSREIEKGPRHCRECRERGRERAREKRRVRSFRPPRLYLPSPDFCSRLVVIITYSPDLSPRSRGSDPRVTDSPPSVP